VGIIRQDWNRICPGLSDVAIQGGHWPEDGSKLDFAGAIGAEPTGQNSALRRWGRLTVQLEGQNGHIDAAFARRLLGDHYEGTRFEVDPLAPTAADPVSLCRHEYAGQPSTQVSLLAELSAGDSGRQLVWVAFGPPCLGVYFPVVLLPQAGQKDFTAFVDSFSQKLWELSGQLLQFLGREPERWHLARERLSWLQARFDEETEEFLGELPRLCATRYGEPARQVQLFMERHAEQIEDMVLTLKQQTLALADSLALG
jgi:hypothetical protein